MVDLRSKEMVDNECREGYRKWLIRTAVRKSLEFVVKCDQESGLKAVIEKARVYLGQRVAEWAPDQIGLEHSPVKDSQSNGMIERCIQSIEGQIRTLRSALQERLGFKIEPDECIFTWLVMHAADTLNHGLVGKDGRVPYQRMNSKKMKRERA